MSSHSAQFWESHFFLKGSAAMFYFVLAGMVIGSLAMVAAAVVSIAAITHAD